MSTLTHQIVPDDILIRHKGENPTPFVTLHQAADTTNCIHIAYLAEGYKQEEMGLFIKDAQTATDALFAHEPFKSKKDKFNIIAVKSDSEESGTSEPSKGIWKNTALSSHSIRSTVTDILPHSISKMYTTGLLALPTNTLLY